MLSFWNKDITFGYIFSLFENMLPWRNTSVDFYGGAIYNQNNASPEITNCLFAGNTAGSYGGAVYSADAGGSPTLNNCTLSGNHANLDGGGIYSTSDAFPYAAREILLFGPSE